MRTICTGKGAVMTNYNGNQETQEYLRILFKLAGNVLGLLTGKKSYDEYKDAGYRNADEAAAYLDKYNIRKTEAMKAARHMSDNELAHAARAAGEKHQTSYLAGYTEEKKRRDGKN